MLKSLLIIIVAAITSASCTYNEDSDELRVMGQFDSGVFLKVNSNISYRPYDFEFYDSSSHIFYFKRIPEELEDVTSGNFMFLDNGKPIYSGIFWPPYMSSLPKGPFIWDQYFQPFYALKIGFIYDDKPDPRNSPEMIRALKKHSLLHSGLSATIDNVIINGTSATVDITVTNRDVTDLLVMNPNKMDNDLFHYFTNGIYIYGPDYEFICYPVLNSRAPQVDQGWSMDWFTRLRQNESLKFTLNYELNEPVTESTYTVKFTFPGLGGQVSHDQLHQGNARIWLGEIVCSKKVTGNK